MKHNKFFKKVYGKDMKKIIALVCAVLFALGMLSFVLVTFSGCSEASRVSYNVSQEANNFNVTRRLAVINARTDAPVFELIGNFSISNSSYNELEITCEVGDGKYKKHYVYLNEWTIYVVEDVSGAYVDKYHYEVKFLPEMFLSHVWVSKD